MKTKLWLMERVGLGFLVPPIVLFYAIRAFKRAIKSASDNRTKHSTFAGKTHLVNSEG